MTFKAVHVRIADSAISVNAIKKELKRTGNG